MLFHNFGSVFLHLGVLSNCFTKQVCRKLQKVENHCLRPKFWYWEGNKKREKPSAWSELRPGYSYILSAQNLMHAKCCKYVVVAVVVVVVLLLLFTLRIECCFSFLCLHNLMALKLSLKLRRLLLLLLPLPKSRQSIILRRYSKTVVLNKWQLVTHKT